MIEELKKVINDNTEVEDIKEFNMKLKHLLDNFIQSDIVSLFIYDRKKNVLNHKIFYDRNKGIIENIAHDEKPLSMISPQGCIGKVFLTKSPAIYNYLTSDKDYIKEYDNALEDKLKSQMLMPVIENDVLLGIVRMSTVIQGSLKKYTQKELSLIKSAEPYFINLIKKLILNKDVNVTTPLDEKFERKIEEELNQQSKLDDDSMLLFLSNTVHDIRTPANSLYGFLSLLEEQLEDKRLKMYVTNAKESASFINTLTDSILETTKNRYESNMSHTETITTIHFLSEITNTFSAKMLEKKIHYFIYISPDIPKEIQIDTLKLKRILMNLIGNAYKFTPVKQQINVEIKWDEVHSKIKFSIKDTGIGIEENDQKKLFKAFSQAHDDISNKYGGTGLGLALSASYVSDLGGELKLKSTLGIGSEFYFDLPIKIIDNSPSYEKFYNLEKKILILTEYTEAKYPDFIRSYLIKMGMPEDKIFISNKITDDVTHLICFEEKITPEVLEGRKANKFKLLLIEQELFSLLNKKELNPFKVTSKNTYNAEAIYCFVFSGKRVNVLVVDDNKINISLLESMLLTEYVEVDHCLDGETAFKSLTQRVKNGNQYDVIYLDKHMPGISGTELLSRFRTYEKENQLDPIFAVSISGDPVISDIEQHLFNAFVNKPFNKNEVREIIEQINNQ